MPIDRKQCTGCTACAAVCPQNCITMEADPYGFPFPAVDSGACTECGLCEKTCPVRHPRSVSTRPAAFAAYSKDEALRMASSSGGIFSELARTVLDRGGAVFGAAYNERFEVRHICAEDEAALKALRGAKYAQSDLGSSFREVKRRLTGGQAVLFSGTPCQVAGLKAFLGQENENLLTVDFVCHGVPSPMVWQEYLKHRARLDSGGTLPQAVSLRCKDTGWSRYRYCALLRYPDGTSRRIPSGERLFMKLFTEDHINREACGACPFKGLGRVSDFTLGDFWGIWDIAPELDDDRGTSFVLVHSEKARRLWNSIDNRLIVKEVSPDEASAQNPSLLHPATPKGNRLAVLEAIRTGGIPACEALLRPSFSSRLKSLLRRIFP